MALPRGCEIVAVTAHERRNAALAAPALPMISTRAVSAQRRCSTATGWATTASGSCSGRERNLIGVETRTGGLGASCAGDGSGGVGLTDTLGGGGGGGGSRTGDGSGAGGTIGGGAEGNGIGTGSGAGAGEGNGKGGGAGTGSGSGGRGAGTCTSGPSNGRAGAGNSRPPWGGTRSGATGTSYERSGTGISGPPNGGTTGFSNALLGVVVSGRSGRSLWPGSRGSANGRRVSGASGSSNRGTDRGIPPGVGRTVVAPGGTRGVSTGSAGAVVSVPARGVLRGRTTLGGSTDGDIGVAPTDPGANRPTPDSRAAQIPLRTVIFISAAPARRRRPSVRPQRRGRRGSVARR